MSTYTDLMALTRHYGELLEEQSMPFDFPSKPRRPEIDRHEIAVKVQNEIGRPLSADEYRKIWNKLTEYMGRDDFLGPFVPVEDCAS